MSPLPPIWLYWSGPMPEYIEFCVATIQDHHPGRVHFASADDVKAAMADIGAPSDRQFIVQHEADILRAWLLKDRGGYWIDCDFLCFAPVDGIVPLDVGTGYHFGAYRRFQDDEKVDNDFVWAAPGSPTAREFWERLKAMLAFNDYKVPSWTAIGGNLLTAIMNERPPGAYEIPYELVTPMRRMCMLLDAFQPNEIDDLIPEGCRGVMLIHSLSKRYLGGKSFEEIIDSRTVIGALFRAALRRFHA